MNAFGYSFSCGKRTKSMLSDIQNDTILLFVSKYLRLSDICYTFASTEITKQSNLIIEICLKHWL